VKAILLTSAQPNQNALAWKASRHLELAAVVLSDNVPARTKPPRERAVLLAQRAAGRTVGRPFTRAWSALAARYRAAYPDRPAAPIVRVRNVNDRATLEAIEHYDPELVVVSGTNLVGARIIEAASRRRGVVNLHTGLSPYVKGGPNCTNWCLAQGWFHLIGNTVMWLDRGIDTGHLIATELTPLAGDEGLDDLHFKVMEHAHDLYVRCLRAIAEGRPVPRVPQASIAEGRTFYTAEWGPLAMARAYANFRLRYRPSALRPAAPDTAPVLVPLDPAAAPAPAGG
jgi:folate-dependent phosphoribosylglycinamide formyltransferase PurN